MKPELSPEVKERIMEFKDSEIDRLSYKMVDPLEVCLQLEREGLLWI